MRKILLIVAGLVLASAAPVAATGTHCPATECPPPVERELQIDIDVIVCGDPRMFVQASVPKAKEAVPTTVKIVYYSGKFKKFNRRIVKKPLDVGDTRVIGPRWIRGGGAEVKIRAWDPIAQAWTKPLIKFQQQKFGDPWGTAGCPEDRFGEPSFETPRYTDSYPG